jgi:hypothetical protein
MIDSSSILKFRPAAIPFSPGPWVVVVAEIDESFVKSIDEEIS